MSAGLADVAAVDQPVVGALAAVVGLAVGLALGRALRRLTRRLVVLGVTGSVTPGGQPTVDHPDARAVTRLPRMATPPRNQNSDRIPRSTELRRAV